MKKLIMFLMPVLLLIPLHASADDYTMLWQQVKTASEKDLPKTQINILNRIVSKASAQRDYGHLIKAQVMALGLQSRIARDSLMPGIERLQQTEAQLQGKDPVLQAVYQAILGLIYQGDSRLDGATKRKSQAYFDAALSDPALLASQSAGSYVPAITEVKDSKAFNNDLLHVIGFEGARYQQLFDYYSKHGNEAAASLCAARMLAADNWLWGGWRQYSRRLHVADSLLNVYQHVPEAGELALTRYDLLAGSGQADAKTKLDYIQYVLKQWSNWPRVNQLKGKIAELTQPTYVAQIADQQVRSGHPFKVNLSHVRNISSLTMRIWRVNVTGEYVGNPMDEHDFKYLSKRMKPLPEATQTRTYVGMPNYQLSTDSITVPGLAAGVYLLEFSSGQTKIPIQRSLVYVSGLFLLSEDLPDNCFRFAVVDRTTGLPVKGAQIKLHYETDKGEDSALLKCNDKGEVFYSIPKDLDNDIEVFAYTSSDKGFQQVMLRDSYYYYNSESDQCNIQLFTDRALYRPGQVVHVAAIAHQNIDGKTPKAVSGAKIRLSLIDTNYKTVSEKFVTTDAMGTASADFQLPSSGLTGAFSIRTDGQAPGYVSFSVEEYKRPTFRIEFPKISQKYAAGDTLVINGSAKSFADVPVQGAKVRYTVTRRLAPWFWWRSRRTQNEEVFSADGVTDNNGNFPVKVPFILPNEDNRSEYGFYCYVVSADITDRSGETRHGETCLPLGSKPTAFRCEMPSQIDRDSTLTLKFNYLNNAGEPIDASVSYSFDGNKIKRIARSNTLVTLNVKDWKSGRYQMQAVCGTDTVHNELIVFSLHDKQPAIKTHDWFYQTANVFPADGKPVFIQVGSSDPEQHILYSIATADSVIENGVIDQNSMLNTRKFTYQPSFGDGIAITYAWVKDGIMYTHTANIRRPLPNLRLNVTWKTFRNRLTPGQKEEWTLQITRPNGRPATAQLLATLYDRSLDEIQRLSWSLPISLRLSLPNMYWTNYVGTSFSVSGSLPVSYPHVARLEYSHFSNEMFHAFDYMRDQNGLITEAYSVAYVGSVQTRSMGLVKPMGASVESSTLSELAFKGISDDVQPQITTQKDVSGQLRENFNETAFFFPALQTDTNGLITMKFTLPESITTWHFIGIAHDAEMRHGQLESDVVAKKTVMIHPNIPRFVRSGDHATITARVMNTTDKNVVGTAQMELIDPENNRVVYTKSCKYTVKGNETQAVAFELNLSEGSKLASLAGSLLICKVTAAGQGYADGEQHYLPILSDQELVTNTVAFTQHTPGTQMIDLDKLFPVRNERNRLTIEYTENPVWLMIQALPYVGNISNGDAISLASVYYVDKLASSLLKSAPQAKQTFELWRRESGKETSLMSALQKNEALKSLALNETPWIGEAEKEAEQKRLLGNFFDETMLNNKLSTHLNKLSDLQLSNGSWSWYPKMKGSLYVTLIVTEMLSRLNAMIGKQAETSRMLTSAFKFMGKEIHREVRSMKKEEARGIQGVRPSESAVHYLYLCALADSSLSASASADKAYLMSRLVKQINAFTIYGKAISAVILGKNGYRQKAKEFLQSIREYTVYTPEMGRYFDTPKAYYSWFDYRIPTEVAAIEAIRLIEPTDVKTVEEMQRWLLQSKRTQSWGTTINTINAIYAFMNGNMDKLDVSKTEQAVLSVDGKRLETPKATAGLGYVKTTVSGEKAHTFTARKTSSGTSWGTVYAQFMQKSTGIKAAFSGFKVTREILGGTHLRVGDKVTVRITITADRDYDFVQIVDKRAACLEPASQLSGYANGYYCTPRDNATHYYADRMSKGKHVIETEYYVDREGQYSTGICTVQCAYSPGYSARAAAQILIVK
ncbi:alpha-2-macroglobulin family protein [Hoylesella enoeca]|uniref:Alpha-2-macroglobulin domain-containing protein n=1 Tax=Hoylesella enoeca TaxID=76123 RepID=A0A0S2KLW1_9BACT|nr:alpha-2-macroglobulin family protein [Hoylesella enoeca]ALO49286.1 hypothetical protein AS203_09450 [Hoylesella enoeca]